MYKAVLAQYLARAAQYFPVLAHFLLSEHMRPREAIPAEVRQERRTGGCSEPHNDVGAVPYDAPCVNTTPYNGLDIEYLNWPVVVDTGIPSTDLLVYRVIVVEAVLVRQEDDARVDRWLLISENELSIALAFPLAIARAFSLDIAFSLSLLVRGAVP